MRVCAWILGAAMLAASPVMAKDGAAQMASPNKAAVNVVAPRPAMTNEQLWALRNGDSAQMAVYDSVEKTWRRPTESEQAHLSQGGAAASAQRTIALPNGGVAVELGEDSFSFLTVQLQADGTMKMDHMAAAAPSSVAKMPVPSLKTAARAKGGL